MPTEEKRREISVLIEHLKKHKDAVLIIGDKFTKDLNLKNIHELEEGVFDRKSWVKTPLVFWENYINNIFLDNNKIKELPSIYKSINRLINLGIIKKVISVNTHGLIEAAINIKGIANGFKCSRCGEFYTKEDLENIKEPSKDLIESINTINCKKCNLKKIRPSCLMSGENYLHNELNVMLSEVFNDNKESEDKKDKETPNTHSIIYIGVDMDEDLMSELFDNYVLVRNRIEDECYNILITDSSATVATFKPEFATSENIEDSLNRLIDLLEK